MSLDENKKRMERRRLDIMRECYSDFPQGPIEPAEEPDFIVGLPPQLFGIELTNLFVCTPPGQHSLRGKETLEDAIAREAETIHFSRGGPPLVVNIMFQPRVEMPKREMRQVAARIAATINEANLQPLESRRICDGWNDPLLPDAVDHITIYQNPRRSQSQWRASRIGEVPQLTPEDIQKVIDRKNGRAEVYRRKCDLLWLVLVVDGEAPSSFLDLSEQARLHHYTTSFDRVLYFQVSPRWVVTMSGRH